MSRCHLELHRFRSPANYSIKNRTALPRVYHCLNFRRKAATFCPPTEIGAKRSLTTTAVVFIRFYILYIFTKIHISGLHVVNLLVYSVFP